MTPLRRLLILAMLTTTAPAACGSGSPTSPSTTSTTTSTAAVTTCTAWAATQRASGVPAATGSVTSQRQALYAAGGGVRAVSNRYIAAWFPSNWATASPRRVLVGLHGTGGAPETEWSVDWKDIVSSKGWAYIGLKYVDDATGSHDSDTTIYANLKSAVDAVKMECDFGSPSMFLVGFSRGSAQAFPVAYLDIKDRRFFKAIGNNSGAWLIGDAMVPTMQAIVSRGETSAYSGTRFWMYCGGRDMEHGYPMCDEMKNAQAFITSYGATVERLYEDPTGTHGGLAKNADAWGAMFSYFEGLR
jgi:predicted esterase